MCKTKHEVKKNLIKWLSEHSGGWSICLSPKRTELKTRVFSAFTPLHSLSLSPHPLSLSFLLHTPAATAAAAKSLQSCPTLCNPTDGSPPGSPIPGILQAKTLEWVAISFSNAWKQKVKVKSLSRVRLFTTPWTAAHRLLRPWDFPGKSKARHRQLITWEARWTVYTA